MINVVTMQFKLVLIAVASLFIIGVYIVALSRNLIRILIGIEIIAKAVTLLFIYAGFLTQRAATAQAMVITIIIIEVAVIAIAAGVVLGVFRRTHSIDAKNVKNLKG